MLPPVVEDTVDNGNTVITIRNNQNNNNHHHVVTSTLRRLVDNAAKRYAEVGLWKAGDDAAFLEPYLAALGPERAAAPPSSGLADHQFTLLPAGGSSGGSLDQDSASVSGSSCEDSVSEEEEEEAACDIGLVERLIRTHPVWFLPGIQRAGAVHLLQGKEEGNFVVRQSSQPDTMAISVRLPQDKGPYIEHYLVQASGGRLGLESSDNRFDNIPSLVAHYSQCCDELPVQLTLPRALREARNRQQLSSLALLGQEFWRYPMANPRPPELIQQTTDVDRVTADQPQISPSSGSSLSSFGSGSNHNNNNNNNLSSGCSSSSRTPTSDIGVPVVLNLAPLSPNSDVAGSNNALSTFKGSPETLSSPVSSDMPSPISAAPPPVRTSRPTPPSTLKLVCSASPSVPTGMRSNVTSPALNGSSGAVVPNNGGKTPPPPPPRWAKPSAHNFTVTTTVTFNVNQSTTPPAHVEVSCVQVTPKRPQPEVAALISPSSVTPSGKSGGKKQRPVHNRQPSLKESQHYQESDILDSPTVYYRSSVADKASDYEDIWGPTEAMLSTFKPIPRSSPFSSPDDGSIRRPPDLLERIGQKSRPSPLTIPPHTPGTPEGDAGQTTPVSNKQGSPFYAEPADALRPIVARRRPPSQPGTRCPASHRHSDPSPSQRGGAVQQSSLLQRIDSSEELALSVDNLRGHKRKVRRGVHDPAWSIDSSWEFIGNDDDGSVTDGEDNEEITGEERERRFPSLEQQESSLELEGDSAGVAHTTVHDLIIQRLPALRLSPDLSPPPGSPPASRAVPQTDTCSRVSSYDNVEGGRSSPSRFSGGPEEDTLTEFSEPWDSSPWERLLNNHHPTSVGRSRSFKDRMDPLMSPPRVQALRSREISSSACSGTGASIRAYALHLAADRSTTFAQNVENFISCTRESRETSPQVVMRNMRQFMSGMKNYLVKHGEREFEKEVEKERVKLRANEFLNLDAILEGVMHKLVVRPLRDHLYRLFVEEYTRSGAIERLAQAISLARHCPPHELGVRAKIEPPSTSAMSAVKGYLARLQRADSPLEKLENLLAGISAIFNSVKAANQGRSVALGADDFLPLFVWVLVQSGMVAAEIEAEYMWGLLHPSLLSGEGGYYLTTLSSAVHVLKSFRPGSDQAADCSDGPAEFRSVLKIVVPDEMHGSIITKTLPVRPNMTTRDVCKIIAHKVRITNPQDYGLFKLVDGEETLLGEGECPQDIRGSVVSAGKHCMFAYKRIDAKIAWPRTS